MEVRPKFQPDCVYIRPEGHDKKDERHDDALQQSRARGPAFAPDISLTILTDQPANTVQLSSSQEPLP